MIAWASHGLALLALATGICSSAGAAEPAAPVSGSFPGGTIDQALELLFEKEGGQGGIGATPLRRSFSIPALNSAELAKAATGNTLRADGMFAVHFERSGHARGWSKFWKESPAAQCEANKDKPGFGVADGQCYALTDVTLDGAWRVADDRLCMPAFLHNEPARERCYFVALVMNNVVTFDEQGTMIGRGWTLARGREVAGAP